MNERNYTRDRSQEADNTDIGIERTQGDDLKYKFPPGEKGSYVACS